MRGFTKQFEALLMEGTLVGIVVTCMNTTPQGRRVAEPFSTFSFSCFSATIREQG